MKTELKILNKHYGSYKAVADALGITYRHYINVRNDKHVGKFLKMRIRQLVIEIKNANQKS